jgi:hypothetical protein
MSDTVERPGRMKNTLAVAARAAGLSAGTCGICRRRKRLRLKRDHATHGGDRPPARRATTPAPPVAGAASAPAAKQPRGGLRSDETPLTGDTATKVKQAALAKLPRADVIRVETDADGRAAHEAHVVTSDGAPATVFVGKDVAVVSVEQR